MSVPARFVFLFSALCLLAAAAPHAAGAPKPGQPGKDVAWVPTPPALIERMLDMAEVTPRDFVMDLGSGDGRAVIAAAKRGVPALGVEYDGELVALARERAAAAGVADKARFVQGDMYEADLSRASVLVLFLIPENLDRLAPKFLAMNPGSRIVTNYYGVSGWKPDRTETLEECDVWCQANLFIVPARVEGEWRLGNATLRLRQIFQELRGTLSEGAKVLELDHGRLHGDRIVFSASGVRYTGRVGDRRIVGERADGKHWTAHRIRPAD